MPRSELVFPTLLVFALVLITWASISTYSNNSLNQTLTGLDLSSKSALSTSNYLQNPPSSTLSNSTNTFLNLSINSTKFYNFSLIQQPWHKKTETIIFLHIVKCGGTSVDRTIAPIIKKLGGKYKGRNHFDWGFIEKYYPQARVVTQLRDPVDRVISNFYHGKKITMRNNPESTKRFLNQTLSEYRVVLQRCH